MKLKYLLPFVVASASFLAAQDTAPDQTAPQSQQSQTPWKDRFNQLKSAATSGLAVSGSSTNGCNASELFGMGDCQLLVNGNRDLLAWRRDTNGIQDVTFIPQSTGGAGIGGNANFLGEDMKTGFRYIQNNVSDYYTVTGTFPGSIKVTPFKGRIPDGLKGGSQANDAAQNADMETNVSPVTPLGDARVGAKATLNMPDGDSKLVVISAMDKQGHVTKVYDEAGKQSYAISGSVIKPVNP